MSTVSTVVSFRLQIETQAGRDMRFVLDNQQCGHVLGRGRERRRQLDAERGAGARPLAHRIGAPAVPLGRALDDEQAEAGAFDALGSGPGTR